MNLLLCFALALWGSVMWNVIWYRFEKEKADKEDKDFDFNAYKNKYKDNWLWSLVFVPGLVAFGYFKMNLGVIHEQDVQWSDAYYLASGFISDKVYDFITGNKKEK